MLFWSALSFWCFWSSYSIPAVYRAGRYFLGCLPLLSILLEEHMPVHLGLLMPLGEEERDTGFHCCHHHQQIRPSTSLGCGSRAGWLRAHVVKWVWGLFTRSLRDFPCPSPLEKEREGFAWLLLSIPASFSCTQSGVCRNSPCGHSSNPEVLSQSSFQSPFIVVC